jgi:hypothetical protein
MDDDDLVRELLKKPVPTDHNFCVEKIIYFNCDTFFERFIQDDCKFGPLEYFAKDKRGWDLNLEKWEMDEKTGHMKRFLKCMIPVKGVPFCN